MLIRDAEPLRDAAACAAIYAPFVSDSAVSFDETPPGEAELSARIERITRTHPWLVAEFGDELAGFAYAAPHRERAAYRWATEVTVYVAASHRRRGAARSLYGTLFELLRRQGLRIALAGITLPNEPSVKLHETLGFSEVGVYRNIGWKIGAWRDVGWWALDLAPKAAGGAGREPHSRPAVPGPPVRLDSVRPG